MALGALKINGLSHTFLGDNSMFLSGHNSACLPITYGVPQGSVLGPESCL